jgi:hypothetical protein
MPTASKRILKSWMLVYVSFVVALTAANFGADAESESDLTLVSPDRYQPRFRQNTRFFDQQSRCRAETIFDSPKRHTEVPQLSLRYYNLAS